MYVTHISQKILFPLRNQKRFHTIPYHTIPSLPLVGENSLSAFYAHVQQWGNLYEHICRIKCGRPETPSRLRAKSLGLGLQSQLVVAINYGRHRGWQLTWAAVSCFLSCWLPGWLAGWLRQLLLFDLCTSIAISARRKKKSWPIYIKINRIRAEI